MKKTNWQTRKGRRYAYIKNGDVVEEVTQVDHTDPQVLRNAGPYHYIASFLKWAADGEKLFISRHSSNKCIVHEKKKAIAIVYNTLAAETEYSKYYWKGVLFS
jgi:hypothetical protein